MNLEEEKEPGYYTILWDGRDGLGREVPSGVYFYRLITDRYQTTRKLFLISIDCGVGRPYATLVNQERVGRGLLTSHLFTIENTEGTKI